MNEFTPVLVRTNIEYSIRGIPGGRLILVHIYIYGNIWSSFEKVKEGKAREHARNVEYSSHKSRRIASGIEEQLKLADNRPKRGHGKAIATT